jgi:hypothetical protein
MSNIAGKVGELRFTVQVTRAETGKVEDYELVGFIDPEQLKAIQEEKPKEQE